MARAAPRDCSPSEARLRRKVSGMTLLTSRIVDNPARSQTDSPPSSPPPSPTDNDSPPSSRTIIRHVGRVIGYVLGKTFYRKMRARHYLVHPPAIAQDTAVLERLQALGAVFIVCEDEDTGDTRTAPLAAFWGPYSIEVDRGCGRQRALPLDRWTMVRMMPASMGGGWAAAAVQMMLFIDEDQLVDEDQLDNGSGS